jgi:hypothetical protein
VEGRQHQLALLHVRALVEQDDRVLADERLEHPGALTGVKDVGRRREDLLDLLGIAQDHERWRQREAHREAAPIARAQLLEIGERPVPETDPLHQCGEARPRRKLRAHVSAHARWVRRGVV